ncbi:DUF805 domain-containing protein [Alsobacter sp. KACC 23698]|uniref:DUF805 domain-containing protein n=1 Tax=Alsobacter sp. KACC 23698 TaxID=3149229 RepID=A0AAU7JAI2_9HYPH
MAFASILSARLQRSTFCVGVFAVLGAGTLTLALFLVATGDLGGCTEPARSTSWAISVVLLLAVTAVAILAAGRLRDIGVRGRAALFPAALLAAASLLDSGVLAGLAFGLTGAGLALLGLTPGSPGVNAHGPAPPKIW